MNSKSSFFSPTVRLSGNEIPIQKSFSPLQMHSNYNSSLDLSRAGYLISTQSSPIQNLSHPQFLSYNSSPSWPYIPKPYPIIAPSYNHNAIQKNFIPYNQNYNPIQNNKKSDENVPYQLIASKSATIIKPMAKHIIKPLKLPKRPERFVYKKPSVPPLLPEDNPLPPNLYYSKKPRVVEYKPYNIDDYNQNCKKPYILPKGLGPANIGADDWARKFEKERVMKEYSQSVRELNFRS
ncbi:unnamed protein product [Blepharisma stoltei]|uniref:Uncharacterized protein n=1 Tax=Blepharisma stoltei TaxID=1481888 RepID=A0AAU9JUZ5_9CILI|nr:unnamed protein product [Blepharisma stoltei]